MKCWGGTWGTGNTKNVNLDSLAPHGIAQQVTVGKNYACALFNNGKVACWGRDRDLINNGQLGIPDTDNTGSDARKKARGFISSLDNVVQIASGGNEHTCALTDEGRVACWGKGLDGRLGDGKVYTATGPASFSRNPVWVKDEEGLLANVTQIGVGEKHSCALGADSKIKCWGKNASGELGISTATVSSSTYARTIASTLNNVTRITLGLNTTCALLSDGKVKCWGNDFAGRLGNGTATSGGHTPSYVVQTNGGSGELSDIVQITRSSWRSICAVNSMGGLRCWGSSARNQLLDGAATNSEHPVIANTDTSGTPLKLDTWQSEYRCFGGSCSVSDIRLSWGGSTKSPSNAPAPTIAVAGASSTKLVTLYSGRGCTTDRGSTTADSTSVTVSPGLGTDGRYDFYFKRNETNFRCSESFLSYHLYLTAPDKPTIIVVTEDGDVDRPVVRVSSVVSGNRVNIFRNDANCSSQHVGAATVAVGSTSLDITVNALGSGSYKFYAQTYDPAGSSSDCSDASETYTYTPSVLFH